MPPPVTPAPETPLLALVAREIREGGPMPLDRYMGLCLGHPAHGYYRTRDPLGRRGDFVTAPEISQMFGELLGVWVAAVSAAMASAGREAAGSVALVELGPGRGTLMADALRALARLAPGTPFAPHLVETSPVLRARQRERLAGHHPAPVWHEDAGSLPDAPLIVLANEFFDALPVRQFERTEAGWCERLIGLAPGPVGPEGVRLAWGLSPHPDPRIAQAAPEGVVLSLPGAALDFVRALAGRIVRRGGALLAVDYGHARPGFGDSLQAVAGHRFADPLARPGEADLTVHVDFSALARAGAGAGARVHGPASQRDFLLALGLRQRADRLKAGAPGRAGEIEAAFARLTDPARGGMGTLFKALALAHPDLTSLPGLSAFSLPVSSPASSPASDPP